MNLPCPPEFLVINVVCEVFGCDLDGLMCSGIIQLLRSLSPLGGEALAWLEFAAS